MRRIPVSGPWITQLEIDYVTDAVASGWYDNANRYHERFESAFCAYLGRKYAIALPSCTSAIHLALLGLGVGVGDEVIVPEITWIASSAPISYVGATPVFADIDPDTWCLSAESFAACITPRTKAVLVVDLYGNMPDMDAIREIAERRGIAIIEDAAEAIGAEYKGKRAGSFGDAGVFSFHGSKTLTTGEGGMLLTDREDLYRRALFLRDHGRNPGDRMFCNTEIGYKYKMSAMQAALGLAQLERVEELVARKRAIFACYEAHLAGVEGIRLNVSRPGVKNVYWMVTVVFEDSLGLKKEDAMDFLAERGIDTRPFFHPLSSLPAYAPLDGVADARAHNAIAYAVSPYAVNLPSGFNVTNVEARIVCDALKDLLAGARSRRSASERLAA